MLYEEAYHATRLDEEGASMGVVSFHDEPIVARDGQATLCFWGDLLGDEDACAFARALNAPATSLPELLLTAWRERGIEALCGLNGLYTIALWDGAARTLYLVNDRFGYRKLYLWETGRALAFSSETKAIASVPGFTAKVDHVALSCFLSTTHLLGNRTLFQGIRHLPPGHVATWRDGRLDLRQYAELPFGTESDAVSQEELFEGMAARVRRAVERAVQPGTGLLLTGGLDSRALAGSLPDDRPDNVRAVSLGHPFCHDIRYGRSIAHRVDLPHHTVFIPDTYIADYAQKAIERTEGMATCHGYWNIAPDAAVSRNRLGWLMTGSISSAVRSCIPHWENVAAEYRADQRDESVLRFEFDDTFNSGFREAELAEALEPAIYHETRGAAWEALLKTYRQAPTDHLLRRIDYVHIREYERHFISRNFEMFGGLARVAAPFLDRDLFDYSYKTRVNRPINRSDWIEMLNKYFPNVSRVPRTATGIPLQASAARKILHRGMMRFYYHILPQVSRGHLGGHDLGATVHYNEWMRGPMRSFVETTLLRDDWFDGLIRRDTIQAILNRHMAEKKDEYSKLSVLLTLAMWRRRFHAN